jgi:hypothetical protein
VSHAKVYGGGRGAWRVHGSHHRSVSGRKPNGSSNTWKLKPFGSPEATKIELAKAYLQLYQQTKDERQKKEAMRLVNEVAAK